MQEIHDITKSQGGVLVTIEYKDGRLAETFRFPNTVLNKGRAILAKFLAESTQKVVFIQNMLFGDGGMDHLRQQRKVVTADRNGLYGVTRLNKPVITQIDPLIETQVIFTSVVAFDEANGHTLNEMALQLSNGDLFSMATFPDLGKTEQMQITWNWRVNFI